MYYISTCAIATQRLRLGLHSLDLSVIGSIGPWLADNGGVLIYSLARKMPIRQQVSQH